MPVLISFLLTTVIIAQVWDLLGKFDRIPLAVTAVMVLVVLYVGYSIRKSSRLRSSSSQGLLRVSLLLSLFLAGVSSYHHLMNSRTREHWEDEREARLMATARSLQTQFRNFLAQFEAPETGWPPDLLSEDRNRQFGRLHSMVEARGREQNRYGWTIYEQGQALAWAGRSTPLNGKTLSSEGGFQFIRNGDALSMLGITRLREDRLLVGEYQVQSSREEVPSFPLPGLEIARRQGQAQVILFEGRPIEQVLDPSLPLGHSEALDLPFRVHLLDPSGNSLAEIQIWDASKEEMLVGAARSEMALGFLGLGLAFGLVSFLTFQRVSEAVGRPLWTAFIGGSSFLWLARLAATRAHFLHGDAGVFGHDWFACNLAGDLLQSPADFLFTALVLAAQAWAWNRSIQSHRQKTDPGWMAVLLSLIPLSALGGFLFLLAREIPHDARFNVLQMQFVPLRADPLLVQMGLYIFFWAWISGCRTSLSFLWKRFIPTGSAAVPRWPWLIRSTAFSAFICAMFIPLITHSSTRQRETFFAEELMPQLEFQQPRRKLFMRELLGRVPDSKNLRQASLWGNIEEMEGLAYEVWREIGLDQSGLSSAVEVYDPEDDLISRFGLDLPWITAEQDGDLNEQEQNPGPSAEDSIQVSYIKIGNRQHPVLVGESVVRAASDHWLTVHVLLLDEDQNIPFLRAFNSSVQLFRGTDPQMTNPELVGPAPLVVVLEPGRIFSTHNPIPSHPLITGLGIHEQEWSVVNIRDERYRTLFRRDQEKTLAVGFSLPSPLQQLGTFARMTILGLCLSFLPVLFSFTKNPFGFRGMDSEGAFARKLTVFFLLASLMPLVALAVFFHRFAVKEISQDLVSDGLTSLSAARRIVDDFQAGTEDSEATDLRDDIMFWVSRVVQQDISLFTDAQLNATSTRELYDSGFLSKRLSGEVYRRLELNGEAYALHDEKLGNVEFQTISAPVSLTDASRGILSLPLTSKSRLFSRKKAEVEEAILIATLAMVLFLTLLAYRLARHISEPVSALSDAAKRIERGDYDAEVQVRGRDETASLVKSFNRMARSLRHQREDLRQRGDYIEKILLNATTGVISTDPQGRVVTMNPAARRLLGIPEAERAGQPLAAVLASVEGLKPVHDSLTTSPPDQEGSWQMDLTRGDKAQNLRFVSLPFRESPAAKPGRILLLEDLTETVRSSRLEAWAEMARRIAHEIKNPLTPIQLSVDHLRKVHAARDPQFDTVLDRCLETIQNQIRALRSIAVDFSSYARIPRLRREEVSVEDLLEEVLSPYRAAPPPSVALEFSVAPSIPPLWVDRALILRALLNLVQNALEAMPQGGTLSIRAHLAPRSDDNSSRRVRIAVKDDGPGMDPSTRDRLFEPYFSTKTSGTGLGLSIVRKTAEEHGGGIEVNSSPGAGTEVILELPAGAG